MRTVGRPRLDELVLPEARVQLDLAVELEATEQEPLVDSWHSDKERATNRQSWLYRRSLMLYGDKGPPVKASIRKHSRGGWQVVVYLQEEP